MLYKVAMKILIHIANLQHGGAERVASRLSQEWAKTHQVLVAVSSNRASVYPAGGDIHELGIPAIAHPLVKLFYLPIRVLRLVQLMRRYKPDYIIGFMEEANFPLIMAALLTGNLRRTQASVRMSIDYMQRLKHLLIRLLYNLPSRVVAVSRGVRQQLVGLGISDRRLVFIANPAPAMVNKSSPPPRSKEKFT